MTRELGQQGGRKVWSPAVKVPKEKSEKESAKLNDVEYALYRRVVGKLMFLITARPDCAFAIKEIARHVSSPDFANMQALRRVVKYLDTTSKWVLVHRTDRE